MAIKIYDFECPNCKLVEEAFINNNSDKQPLCPRCKKAEMKRLMPAPIWKWAAGRRGF